MNKTILLNIIILILSIPVINAQAIRGQKENIENLPNFDKKTLRFGYYLGINSNTFKVSYYDQDEWINPIPDERVNDVFVSVNSSLGFSLGFVVDYKLHKNINLRFEPGLVSSTKELTYINPYIDGESNGLPTYTGTDDPVRKVSGTYMHLPLLLKFSTNRLKNIRPYVIGGVSYDYNFSSNETNSKDNYDTEFRMKSHNFMYEAGIGMDFYFSFFKFSPSIRGVFAINDELVRDNYHDYSPTSGDPYPSPWTSPIDYFGTRGIFLNLAFQ